MSKANYSAANGINRLIDSSGSPLAQLLTKADTLLQLEEKINFQLRSHSLTNCKVRSYHKGILTLQAESAAWATRIRYQQNPLIEALKKIPALSQLRQIKMVVRPKSEPIKNSTQAHRLSCHSSLHLQQIADSFGKTTLGEALRKLAENRQQ